MTEIQTQLGLENQWYIACHAKDLKNNTPKAVRLCNICMVLFRAKNGQTVAMLDRCPHRNVPLSCGYVKNNEITCKYHGWRFNEQGDCTYVSGLLEEEANHRTRRATTFPVCESQGFVWVMPIQTIATATKQPFIIPHVQDKEYGMVPYVYDFDATLFSVAENILDVQHTSYLHKGLFRTPSKNKRTVKIKKTGLEVSAEYCDEPRPAGLLGKLLAPRGGTVIHFDRFILPSIAQVEYRLGEHAHLLVTNVLVPVEPFRTRIYVFVAFRLPWTKLLNPLIQWIATPFAKRVLYQDATILAAQTHNIRQFGKEHFTSTPADCLAPHISRLLRYDTEKSDHDVEKSYEILM